jgi:uncharacterized phage protein (TIGR01671 family)
MKTIKFRGKRVEDNEWVYGYYFHDTIKKIHYIVTHELGVINAGFKPRKEDYILAFVEVILETVGQYTGVTDINDVDIWEGDVLQSGIGMNFKWEVTFEDGAFLLEKLNHPKTKKKTVSQDFCCKDDVELYELVVIGNIHDNPELLEVKPNE